MSYYRRDSNRRKSDIALKKSGDTCALNWKSANQCAPGPENMAVAELPWGALKVVQLSPLDPSIMPAKYCAQTLIFEIFGLFDRKLHHISIEEPIDKPLGKTLRRGEDAYFENLLHALHGICETCLPSVLSALIRWHEEQQKISLSESGETKDRSMKKTLGASYLFCVVMIEILPQLHYHPMECEQHISWLVDHAFHQISFRDPAVFGANYQSSLVVAETFSEVLGVLSQSHAKLIQKAFFSILNPLRKETPMTSTTLKSVISLLMGMKYFRIKTNQVADIEMGVKFLDELATYYLEVDLKQKDLKHALSGLLVELLTPVAAMRTTEIYNIPDMIAFVEKLYAPAYDLVNKKQHKMAAYPLLTCLLSISQSKFFSSSWVQFLNLTLANLKNKDPKISRIALESLQRLLWVYVIRNNCEGNTTTRSRLESICSSLFPRGNRYVVPREAPLGTFVRIIEFIAQPKLDFAFKEVIFDLLGCNRPLTRTINIYPERMNIAIRAVMVIADDFQQGDGPPAMPRSVAPPASGTIMRVKRTYSTKPLTSELASSIGLEQYYLPCRKAFDLILRALDLQVGRPLMLTSTLLQSKGKDYEDVVVGDVRPKLDLLRLCLATIPRLLPDPMSPSDLMDLLARMTIHIDEELRVSAYQALQNIISDCPEWREEAIQVVLRFFSSNMNDTQQNLVESTCRLLLQLLSTWRASLSLNKPAAIVPLQPGEPGRTVAPDVSPAASKSTTTTTGTPSMEAATTLITSSTNGSLPLWTSALSGRTAMSPQLGTPSNATAYALHCVEGLALVLLCQLKSQTRKLAASILRECRHLLQHLTPLQETPLMSVLEEATPYVIEKYCVHFSPEEKKTWGADFSILSDKLSSLDVDNSLVSVEHGNEYFRWDPWACALSGYTEYQFVVSRCPTAAAFAWPLLFNRLNYCNQFVDPSNPQNENRASLLRNSKSKSTITSALCGELLGQESYLQLWQKYLVVCCALCPRSPSTISQGITRSFSPGSAENSHDTATTKATASSGSIRTTRSISLNCIHLFQKLSPMLRWEGTDMRDSVVLGVGSVNPLCFEQLWEEFSVSGITREIFDKKVETNTRRRKRKEQLRSQLLRVLEMLLFRGLLHCSNNSSLPDVLRSVLDVCYQSVSQAQMEKDRDAGTLHSLQYHFANVIVLLVEGVHLERRRTLFTMERERSYFQLFYSWWNAVGEEKLDGSIAEQRTGHLREKSLEAMCALSSCGLFEQDLATGGLNETEKSSMFTDWLRCLLSSECAPTYSEGVLPLLLHLSDEHSHLYEWMVDCCYAEEAPVDSRAFKALALLFAMREYPCDSIEIAVLCMTMGHEWNLEHTALSFLKLAESHILSTKSVEVAACEGMVATEADVTSETKNAPLPLCWRSACATMSTNYPQLTLQIFSEVSTRLETANSTRQTAMLGFLVYWMRNIELVDPNCNLFRSEHGSKSIHAESSLLASQRWGCEEGTQLVLNNLLYFTAVFGLQGKHIDGISSLWHALASHAANIPVIIHYLSIMSSLAFVTLLPVAQRIICSLVDIAGESLVGMMIACLSEEGTSFGKCLLRSENYPFYRWASESGPDGPNDNAGVEVDSSPIAAPKALAAGEKSLSSLNTTLLEHRMPAYGGYNAPLCSFLFPSESPLDPFKQSDMAFLLLAEAMRQKGNSGWASKFIPNMLHYALVNLDSNQRIVRSHSHRVIADALLNCSTLGIASPRLASISLAGQTGYAGRPTLNRSRGGVDRSASSVPPPDETCQSMVFGNAPLHSFNREELLLATISCLTAGDEQPLVSFEEVSPRSWHTESAVRLTNFVRRLTLLLDDLHDFVSSLSAVAMRVALSTSKAHLACRSFQISAALQQHPAKYIPQLISRLVEVLGSHTEESQTILVSTMLYLRESTQWIRGSSRCELDIIPPPSTFSGHHTRSVSYTPSITHRVETPRKGGRAGPVSGPTGVASSMASNPEQPVGKSTLRHSMIIEHVAEGAEERLARSKSVTSIMKAAATADEEEELGTLHQLMYASLTILESPSEHEYLLALHLVEKIFDAANEDLLVCLNRIAGGLQEGIAEWTYAFPGIVGLLSRGSLLASGQDCTLRIYAKLVPLLGLLEQPLASSLSDSMALIITASLPHLLVNYEAPSPPCLELADSIARFCKARLRELNEEEGSNLSPREHPLCNLATMMDQYKEGIFTKDRLQWCKCIVTYMLDSFSTEISPLAVFLAEVLERSNNLLHNYVLNIISHLIGHGTRSFADSPATALNAQVVRIVSKHLQGPNSKEASKILKLLVDQWYLMNRELDNGFNQRRTPDFDLYVELPKSVPTFMSHPKTNAEALGRTSPTLVTPRKFHSQAVPVATAESSLKRDRANTAQTRVRDKLISLLTASGLQVNQRFRQSSSEIDHPAFDHEGKEAKAGLDAADLKEATQMPTIPPAAIYSDPHEIIQEEAEEMSAGSSTEPAGSQAFLDRQSSFTTDSFPRVFREFDFLEAEHDTVSESTDSCFHWLATMRTPENGEDVDEDENEHGDGDDHEDEYQQEQDYYEDEEGETTANCSGSTTGDSAAVATVKEATPHLRPTVATVQPGHHHPHYHNHPFASKSQAHPNVGARFSGARRMERRVKRPRSKTSDSSRASSLDRTPMQSERGSDDEEERSSPSCPISELEEEDEQEGETLESRSPGDDSQRKPPSTSAEENREKGGVEKQQAWQAATSSRSSQVSSTLSPVDQQTNHDQLTGGSASHAGESQRALGRFPLSIGVDEDVGSDTGATSRASFHSRSEFSASAYLPPLAAQLRGTGCGTVLECNHHMTGKNEKAWVALETPIDAEGTMTANALIALTQLLKESSQKVSCLLQDASAVLNQAHPPLVPQTSSMGHEMVGMESPTLFLSFPSYFQNVHSTMQKLAECPFLFVTPQFLKATNLVTNLEFVLYELRGHHETYCERREQCIRALHAVKSSAKLLLVNGTASGAGNENMLTRSISSSSSVSSMNLRNQEIELCKWLQKLIFQLLLLVDGFHEVIRTIQFSSNAHEYDLSPAVASLQRELLEHVSGSAASPEIYHDHRVEIGRPGERSPESLVLQLVNRQFSKAINLLHSLRSQYGNEFGCCDQTDVEVLLLSFCRSHSFRTWAIVGSTQSLYEARTELKEASLLLNNLVRRLTELQQPIPYSRPSEGCEEGLRRHLSATPNMNSNP